MDKYLVVGNPIAQSKSPVIHGLFAQETQQNMMYSKELIAVDDFKGAIENFISSGVKGINVTAPFKEQAFELCDELSEFAAKAGAVNTLIFKEGAIYGDNTDGVGLVNDFINHNVELSGKSIVLLGAGGASKGVVSAMLAEQPAKLTIANRSVEKAQSIAELYPDQVSACRLEELADIQADIVINATSAGLNGQSLNIPSNIFHEQMICYDMTYGKALTPFLTFAKNSGSKQLIDGLGMLVGQAAQSFYIWRGVKPSTDGVISQLREQMSL